MRQTLAPDAVAKVVADRHGTGTEPLFTWRRDMLATAMSGLMPVEVLPETPRVRAPETTAGTPGVVEVTMPSGVTVHVSGCVDLAVLRGVLAEFGERCVRPIARHAGVPGLRRDRHAEGL